MRAAADGGGCFPTGRHYPGIAHLLRVVVAGILEELGADAAVGALPWVAIDTETTGMDPAEARVIEIACVWLEADGSVGRKSWLVDPGRPIPAEAVAVHGITDEAVRGKPAFAAIAHELLEALEARVPVAYNADFDRAFLLAELGRAGVLGARTPPAVRRGVEWIDPLVWARELFKYEKGFSLGEMCARVGVSLATAHRATDDAEAALGLLQDFLRDTRVPRGYAAFLQEQRRLARLQGDDRNRWRARL